ncbi:hypothetical protein ACFRJ9_23865 [Paenarthrobacter sp. NPDC056912]|uniref:hypothetical protein n=1 Tax=Paenarthrobacter sp. NPDC056912 TaxID=3345965 RepID=UPI00366AFE73
MSTETPRDADGNKLCGWCGGPIQQKGVGRSRDYCTRTHKEYAYRARRDQEIRFRAYSKGRADERFFSTTAETPQPSNTSVVETQSPQVNATNSPSPPAPLPPLKRARRRSAQTASAMPLWPPADDGEPDDQPPRTDS